MNIYYGKSYSRGLNFCSLTYSGSKRYYYKSANSRAKILAKIYTDLNIKITFSDWLLDIIKLPGE
jgi:hypothetical protein